MKSLAIMLACVVLAASLCVAQTTGPANVVEFPVAGVSLAIPEGFELQAGSSSNDVFRAVKLEPDGKPRMVLALSAYYMQEEATPDKLADFMLEGVKRSLEVRKAQELRRTKMPVAGQAGVAHVLSYEFRNVVTHAARAYWVRQINGGGGYIGYVLTVEAGEKAKDQQLSTLGSVIRNLSLIPLRHPLEVEPGMIQQPLVYTQAGISIKVPLGWFAQPVKGGILLGQTDFLAKGQPWPQVQIIAMAVPKGSNVEAWAKMFLDRGLEASNKGGFSVETLSQGEKELGGKKGYQYTMRQFKLPVTAPGGDAATAPEAPAAASAPAAVENCIVQRTAIFARPEQAQDIAVTVLTVSHDCSAKQLEALTDRISKGVADVKPADGATTAPADKTE